MPSWPRRNILKLAAAAPILRAPHWRIAPTLSSRERLLLDAGWRFHPGHANDLTQDFGFGHGGNQDTEFGKSGDLFRPSRNNFDESGWQRVDLPHDWAVTLPFVEPDDTNDFGHYP